MRAMRGMAVLAALMMLCSLGVWAQAQEGGGQSKEGGQRRGRMMSPEDRLKRMTDDLNLSKDQQDKIKPILEDQQKEMEALRNNGSSMEENREKMMKSRSETNEKIKAVLNDDQKKKFDEMQQRGPGRGGDRRPEGAEKPAQPPR